MIAVISSLCLSLYLLKYNRTLYNNQYDSNMQRNLILTILGLCLAATAFPQEKETQFAFNNYHRYYNEARQRGDAEKEKSIKLSALPLRSILTVIIPWTPG